MLEHWRIDPRILFPGSSQVATGTSLVVHLIPFLPTVLPLPSRSENVMGRGVIPNLTYLGLGPLAPFIKRLSVWNPVFRMWASRRRRLFMTRLTLGTMDLTVVVHPLTRLS
jgi:hypothetical protein